MTRRIHHRWFDALLATVALTIFCFAIFTGLPRLQSDNSIRFATALLPPQMDENGQGRETDIILAALRAGGIEKTVEFHVMPFTRHWQIFESDNRFDAVTTVPQDIELSGLMTRPYIAYQNGIIFRSSTFPDGLGKAPLETLADKRVVAFAGASTILPGVNKLGETATLYLERADQLSHSIMFADRFVDAVIADELIFTHYTRQLLRDDYSNFLKTSMFAPAFCSTPYRIVFRDHRLRDAFNKGLSRIKANGKVSMINKRYQRAANLTHTTATRQGCS